MNVAALIARFRALLLESGSDAFFQTAEIVGHLNEALRYHRDNVMRADPDGTWLAEEATAVYTASSRSVPLTQWSPAGAPLKIHSLILPGSTSAGDQEIPYVGLRRVTEQSDRLSDQYFYVLMGNTIGLRPSPPSAALSLRMLFTPPIYPLQSSGNMPVPPSPAPPAAPTAWDAYEPPWVADHYEVLASYAAVLATGAAKDDESFLARQHDQLERSLLDFVTRGRQNQQQSEVRVTSMWRYQF